jgi:putative restriction endonuclease
MQTSPAGLAIENRYTQDDIEEMFDTGFGYQITGINPRRDGQDERYVLLFANEDGPYNDSVTQGRFEYVGEGLRGDQSETSPGNSVLIDAVDSDFPIHFFYQQSDLAGWGYQGLVDVLGWESRRRKGREILVFTMEHREEETSDVTADVKEQRERLRTRLTSEPTLTAEVAEFTDHQRRVRDSAFAGLVKENYDETCVVCGKSRETPEGDPEVEAAHIYPKSENGVDDVRNGLALCKLHHWAFDNGWLAVSDDYELLVRDVPEREGYYEFKQLEGDQLVFPENPDVLPHQLYLEAHRKLHGF